MRNNNKRIKGLLTRRMTEEEDAYNKPATKSPYLRALENPDILSDESRMYPERDFDAEAERAAYLDKMKRALLKMTPAQRKIVEAMAKIREVNKPDGTKEKEVWTQQQVADELGITQETVSVTLKRLQKKLLKSVYKMSK